MNSNYSSAGVDSRDKPSAVSVRKRSRRAHLGTMQRSYVPFYYQKYSAMSGIKDSLKDLLSQVFGRADFADVLEDRWEYSETFEGEVISGTRQHRGGRGASHLDHVPATAEMEASPLYASDGGGASSEPAEDLAKLSETRPSERSTADVGATLPQAGTPVVTLPPEQEPAVTLPQAQEPAVTIPQAQEPSVTIPQAQEPSVSAEESVDSRNSVGSSPGIPAQQKSSLDTGNLIAQIAFDSPTMAYPGPAGGNSALSGEVASLPDGADLGAIVAGAETTAVTPSGSSGQRQAPRTAPLLLVRRDESPKRPKKPLRLQQTKPKQETHDSSAAADTLKADQKQARRQEREQAPPEEEDSLERIVTDRSVHSVTLSMSAEEHAPLTSYDFGVLAPPPNSELKARLREQLVSNLESDLDNLSSAPEEQIIQLLIESLEDPKIDLPPFPSAAKRLLGSGADSPEEDDVLDVVKSDPGLAGSVIRAANSPFYMAAAPVASLGSAVVRIGLREVRRVALAAAMASTFDVKGFEPLIDSAHVHSLTAGTSAEALSRTFSIEPGVAFLSGLLHNAGELLTYRLLRRAYGKGHPAEAPWHDRLEFVHNMALKYHCYFGAMFIEPWDLPKELEASLVYHHHPYLAGDEHEELASLIHVANATGAAAIRHARSQIWQEYLSRLKKQRDQNSSPNGRSTAGVDGIELVPIVEIMEMLPPGFPKSRIHSIIRDILLRVAASSLADHPGDVSTVTHY